jgi:predicted  nucleic acid-binding Zn-ribbon protein
MESEKSEYPPQNDCGNSDAGTNSGAAESVDQQFQGVPSDLTIKATKGKIHCTVTCVLIAMMLFALMIFAAIIAGLSVYVSHLHVELGHIGDRMDKLETECSSGCATFSTNITQTNSEVEGGDEWSVRISNLSAEIDGVKVRMSTLQSWIQTVQATHENDMDQIRMNVSTMLTQINASLIESLQHFTEKAMSNISELSRDVQRELSGVRNHSFMFTQNVSALTDRVSLLDMRSDNLEMSATTLNSSLSQIDTSHRIYLENLSSDLNDLGGELIAAKEVFLANASALRQELTELSNGLDYTNGNLTKLSSAQKRLLLDLAEINSGNISAIGQNLVHLNEELEETSRHLENLSSIQDGLRRNLGLTNEALRSNVSALELRFNGEINRTQVQLQSQYAELWLNFSTTGDRLEANVSALQESHGRLQEDLDRTKIELQIVSSEHINLQGDYNMTKLTFYTTKAAIERNVTQLHTLIRNHSSVLGEHGRLLEDAAQTRSNLLNRIDETSNSVTSLGTVVSVIRSNVTLIQSSVTGLRGTLTTNVNNLNTRIDDHVDWIQHSFDDQSERLTNFDRRISAVEASDAIRVMPLGFLLLNAIALFVCYIVMF